MGKLPTLTITTGNGPVVINAEDFDPAVHELATPVAETPAQEGEAPVAPVPAPVAPVAPETGGNEAAGAKLFVAKAGKRFKVVNESGTDVEGFQKTGYADEAAAWEAIKAAQ